MRRTTQQDRRAWLVAGWTKKILRECSDDFEAGEDLLRGVFVQPVGTAQGVLTRSVGSIGRRWLAAPMTLEDNSTIGQAAELPDSSAVVGMTTRRLIVWDHSKLSGQPTRYKMSLPIDELASVHTEPARMVHGLLLGFRDGSAKLYEAPRIGNDPKGFAAVFATMGLTVEGPAARSSAIQ